MTTSVVCVPVLMASVVASVGHGGLWGCGDVFMMSYITPAYTRYGHGMPGCGGKVKSSEIAAKESY